MKRTTLIAVALAVLIAATGFAAAAPGNAPVSVDTGADSTDEQHTNERGDDERSENGAAVGSAADERDGQGPTVDLPDQAPDHVSAIHERISSFLSGDLEGSLGNAIGEVTPGDDEEPDEADDTEDESQETDDEGADDDHDESDDGDE
ncbi:hypothetical protein [Natrinema salaciae]|uniref:Uncharacterized protein n=1 Tax=Natrinema salaciae TaxID=1186196 RepID=A0A1H9I423_9EURY|nr:hypothetical protein [Natrinema salaciae]SEQ69339.1 hypothetical protein SAMN04489841_2103 [Natrinema salaciae]